MIWPCKVLPGQKAESFPRVFQVESARSSIIDTAERVAFNVLHQIFSTSEKTGSPLDWLSPRKLRFLQLIDLDDARKKFLADLQGSLSSEDCRAVELFLGGRSQAFRDALLEKLRVKYLGTSTRPPRQGVDNESPHPSSLRPASGTTIIGSAAGTFRSERESRKTATVVKAHKVTLRSDDPAAPGQWKLEIRCDQTLRSTRKLTFFAAADNSLLGSTYASMMPRATIPAPSPGYDASTTHGE
jgi:hypothetical protein